MKFISNYKMSFLFFMSGILCLIAYNIKGSSIDENGFLVESFGFIPIVDWHPNRSTHLRRIGST